MFISKKRLLRIESGLRELRGLRIPDSYDPKTGGEKVLPLRTAVIELLGHLGLEIYHRSAKERTTLEKKNG